MSDPIKIFGLSKVFHQQARLAIMTLLAAGEGPIEFTELLKRLRLTKGNLALHLRTLEEAGYIKVNKEFVERIPRTTYEATSRGLRDFSAYLTLLEEIIVSARSSE